MFRSGSTWSFNIVKSIMKKSNPGAPIFSEYNEDVKKVLNEKIEKYDNIVIKCHNLDKFGKSLISHHSVKIIYTYRNPLEAITSGMQVFNQKLDDVIITIKNS